MKSQPIEDTHTYENNKGNVIFDKMIRGNIM